MFNNIGAEGQLTIGALAAASVGALFPNVPHFFCNYFCWIKLLFFGGLWGGIAGYLKAKRGAYTVITTIMLNFIAAGIASYITVYILKDTNSQNPQTIPISKNYVLEPYQFLMAHQFLLRYFFPFCCYYSLDFLYRTPYGYEIRCVGENESATSTAGISISKTQMKTMFIAGALADWSALVKY